MPREGKNEKAQGSGSVLFGSNRRRSSSSSGHAPSTASSTSSATRRVPPPAPKSSKAPSSSGAQQKQTMHSENENDTAPSDKQPKRQAQANRMPPTQTHSGRGGGAEEEEASHEALHVDGDPSQPGHVVTTPRPPGHGHSPAAGKAHHTYGKSPSGTLSYRADKVVGNGTFGVVFLATCLEMDEQLAIKRVLQDRRYKNRELSIMLSLNHPNVIGLKHHFYTTNAKHEVYLNLALEFVPETVYRVNKHYCKEGSMLPMDLARLYSLQLLRSLAYIHSQNICHRDIKPQNLLIGQNNELKLCDFGSAKVLVKGEPNIAYICSRYYRAPELILGSTDYSTSIDVWSAGCVIGEMLIGQPMFPGDSGVDQLVEIIKVMGTPTKDDMTAMNPNHTDIKLPAIRSNPWSKLFASVSDSRAPELVASLLSYAPHRRLTALEACAHSFFDPINLADPAELPSPEPHPQAYRFTQDEVRGAPSRVAEKLLHVLKAKGNVVHESSAADHNR